ncbi:MAG TPA: DUF5329 domain-containing protein, partial [Xanthomonadales bacterium]|nr:DUF5329 domain-containing protein [Xanthomonadales bacterium]
MKMRSMFLLGIALALSHCPLAFAEPLTTAHREIHYLLDFVEISGCEFYRNGTWYDSVKAQEHLRIKYEYLAARNRLATAEDFIELAASRSSLSGLPYEIRCGVCTTHYTGEWLTGVLERYRTVTARSLR